uniref:Outer membrane protein beta-barrel domain-containing protein n=1 Tax=uncultured bacterium A1Q1_fos_2140 TaxID=1256565 RepID=L7VWX4_9BACT|nr:hypothetical protein [uncultured bacterium A1Q1_fos_2140]
MRVSLVLIVKDKDFLNMRKIILVNLLLLSYAYPVFSGTMGDAGLKPHPILYVGGYGGYGTVSGGYKNDGNVAQERFTLGVHIKQYRQWMLGSEVGIQSGNTMRLATSSSVLDPATDLIPQAILKPLVDFLFTVKGQIQPDKPLYYILKGGIAYRQLQLEDRTSTYGDGLSNLAGEFQAGVGMNITEHVQINVFYQGIYSSKNAGVYLDSAGNTPVSHIPTQQAGFLGVEYSFF